jgi:hypothetical protein
VGYKLHSVTTLTQLLDYYEMSGKVPSRHIAEARQFITKNM